MTDKIIDASDFFKARTLAVQKQRSINQAQSILDHIEPYNLAVAEIDLAIQDLDGIETRLRKFGKEMGLDLTRPGTQKVLR